MNCSPFLGTKPVALPQPVTLSQLLYLSPGKEAMGSHFWKTLLRMLQEHVQELGMV